MTVPRKLLCPQCRNRGDGTCDACGGGGYVTPAEKNRIIHGDPLTRALKVIENLPPPPKPMPKCHIPGCGREIEDPDEKMVCLPCRFSWANGYCDGRKDTLLQLGVKPEPLCSACGHFPHPRAPCGWHGGTCVDTSADPRLWCPCDGKTPNWAEPATAKSTIVLGGPV
jgi:hypothetical protein